ncbi:MAG: hypothetical protein ABFC84_16655 [Veillonellales bacterium]
MSIIYLDEAPVTRKAKITYLDEGTAIEPEVMPKKEAFLPNLARTEQKIKERGSQFQGLINSAQELQQHPIKSLFNPVGPLSFMRNQQDVGSAVFGTAEAPIAAAGLAVQRNQPAMIPTEAFKALKGQRQAQLGDWIRTTGFGGILNEPISALTGLGGMAALTGGLSKGKTTKMIDSAGKKIVRDIRKIPTETVSKVRDYPANKVNAIRENFWNKYAPQEWKAFGQAIEDLPKGGTGNVQGADVIQKLEETLSKKNLLTPEGTLQRGFTNADNKLIKAYQNISRKWANNPKGEIGMQDIVAEYKNIRGKYTGKPTPAQRQDIQAANDFFNSVSDQINNKAFSAAKMRYRNFKENQQMTHEAIDLYAPEMKTAKGERFLTKGGLTDTTQGRRVAQMITKETGQKLRGAQAYTRIQKINPLTWVKR